MREVTFGDPFFDEIGKYAVRFAVPVIFGESPTQALQAPLRNGTATLVRMSRKCLAVTCHHVLEGFRRERAEGRSYFQLGRTEFDPEDRLVDEDAALDLAVLDLTDLVGRDRYLSEANFFEPVRWPPKPVLEDDVLCFAGFPGIWRDQVDVGHLRFYSFSSGASEVVSVQDDLIVTSIQFDECITQINHGKVLGSLGGMSGGPAFVWRDDTLLTAELVGFIFEHSDALDILRIRSASVLGADGRIGS